MKYISILLFVTLASCSVTPLTFSSAYNSDSIFIGTHEKVLLSKYGAPAKVEFYVDALKNDTITIKSYYEELFGEMYLVTSFYFKDSLLISKQQKEITSGEEENTMFKRAKQRTLIKSMIKD